MIATENTEVLSACRYTAPAKDAMLLCLNSFVASKEQDICPQMNTDERRYLET